MTRIPDQLPREREATIGKCDPHRVYDHSAFGVITMTTPTGGSGALFNSDIRHSQCVQIKVSRAELHRNLSNDWIHGQHQPVLVLEMSHAQFAQFITSNGNGSGTPCTLRYAPEPGTPTPQMPGIQMLETKGQTFKREIKESSSKQMENIAELVAQLGAMIDSGKVGKKELRELHHTLKCRVENAPTNMAFVVSQAEEALEKITSHAKIEIEAYIDNAARRVGLENIQRLEMLENKEKPE